MQLIVNCNNYRKRFQLVRLPSSTLQPTLLQPSLLEEEVKNQISNSCQSDNPLHLNDDRATYIVNKNLNFTAIWSLIPKLIIIFNYSN